MTKAEVVAPVLATDFVRFAGDPKNRRYVEHVTLKGLSFQHVQYPLPPQDMPTVRRRSAYRRQSPPTGRGT